MKTKTYKVYTFDELSPKARARAISNHRDFVGEQWSGETTIEDAKQCLAFAGWDVSEIHYSGFWSQGDGACFEGSWRASDVKPAAMREHAPVDTVLHGIADRLAKLAEKYPKAVANVRHSGHYSHEYCTVFSVTADDDGNDMPEADEKELIEVSRDAMRWIYRQLEKEYEWETDEAQVIDSIRANEYEFTEDGKID